MFKFTLALVIFSTVCCGDIFAQDTLPSISVINRDGKVIVSWLNAYGATVTNIYIQRSTDSLKRFSTIGSVLSPMNRENGYVDTKYPGGRVFYRVFVAFEGGSYVFTRSHLPQPDTTGGMPLVIERREEPLSPATLRNFVPSKFVFTGKDNNVIINLPNAATAKYSIKFFDEADKFLFEVHSIKEPYLILEKVNFIHAGWYNYQLFNNDILLEKYKFFIPKDGKYANNGRDLRNK